MNIKVIKIEGPVIRGRKMTTTITIKQNFKTCHVRWNCGNVDSLTNVLRFFENCLFNEKMREALLEWLYLWKPTFGTNADFLFLVTGGYGHYIPKDAAYVLVDILHDSYSRAMKQLETKYFSLIR